MGLEASESFPRQGGLLQSDGMETESPALAPCIAVASPASLVLCSQEPPALLVFPARGLLELILRLVV